MTSTPHRPSIEALAPAPTGQVRRASALIARFEADQLVVENYLTGRETFLHHQLLPPLAALTDPTSRHLAARNLSGAAHAEPTALLDQLLAQDVLLECDTREERRDRAIASQWPWGEEARWFHYRTRRTRFGYDLATERAHLLAHAQIQPPPAPFTDLGPPHLDLPAPHALCAGLGDVLRRRRTHRRFKNQPITLQELATVLHVTWGVTEQRTDPGVGPLVLKTSPSGGARHPTEVYCVALNVRGLRAGVYHYCAGRHSLSPLGATADPAGLTHAVVDVVTQQPWAGHAAAVFLMTSVTRRSAWKYPQAHAYRVLLLDAGHLGQTFHLVCTALGLAPWTTAALDEDAAEELLGLDDPTELVLYAAACGLPDEPDAGAPGVRMGTTAHSAPGPARGTIGRTDTTKPRRSEARS